MYHLFAPHSRSRVVGVGEEGVRGGGGGAAGGGRVVCLRSHRVSVFRNVQPELTLQRSPAGAGRSKLSVRVNYTDLRQM